MLRKGHVAMDRPPGSHFKAWTIAGRELRIRTEGGNSLVSSTGTRGPGHLQQEECLGQEPFSDACLSPGSEDLKGLLYLDTEVFWGQSP